MGRQRRCPHHRLPLQKHLLLPRHPLKHLLPPRRPLKHLLIEKIPFLALAAASSAIAYRVHSQLDAVTALSGSGPAYFFLFMEAMQEAGQALGLPENTARLLALQTAFGAAKMALESSNDPATLRQRVTSPGGTTERAIGVFRDAGLESLVLEAMKAAADRSREIGKQLGSA